MVGAGGLGFSVEAPLPGGAGLGFIDRRLAQNMPTKRVMYSAGFFQALEPQGFCPRPGPISAHSRRPLALSGPRLASRGITGGPGVDF